MKDVTKMSDAEFVQWFGQANKAELWIVMSRLRAQAIAAQKEPQLPDFLPKNPVFRMERSA